MRCDGAASALPPCDHFTSNSRGSENRTLRFINSFLLKQKTFSFSKKFNFKNLLFNFGNVGDHPCAVGLRVYSRSYPASRGWKDYWGRIRHAHLHTHTQYTPKRLPSLLSGSNCSRHRGFIIIISLSIVTFIRNIVV